MSRQARSWIAIALASGAVVLGAGPPAQGSPHATELIRPGVGIGKVRLGMTRAQVRDALGRHTVVNVRERRFGLIYLELAYDYSAYTVGFLGASGSLRVVSVATSLRRERTRDGLGPGTPLRVVRRALRGERCHLRDAAAPTHFQTVCVVTAASGTRTTFVAAPRCSAQTLTCGASFVLEVAVSRGIR